MLVRPLGWEIPWRRAWQPTPVFLPGESLEQRSLAGYCPMRSQRVGHNSSKLAHRHACTCMYRCIWDELWVYILFMWSIHQSNTCAPFVAFPFFLIFWKNWVFGLEFFTCKSCFNKNGSEVTKSLVLIDHHI